MSKALMIRTLVVILLTMFSGGRCLADTYSYTFTSKAFSSNGTVTLDGADWTLAGNGDYWGYVDSKGQHLGSGSSPYKTLTLSTSDIKGTITEVKINTCGGAGTNAVLKVSVGGQDFGEAVSITNTQTDYSFTGSASGELVFKYTQTSSVAIYIKSITVTYDSDTAEPELQTQNLTFSRTECSVMLDGSDFAEPALTGAQTTVTYESGNTTVATIDASSGEVTIAGLGTTVITATAAASDTYKEATASYTITVLQPVQSDEYVALVARKGDSYYAMTSVCTDSRMDAEPVSVVNGKVVVEYGYDPSALMWKITADGTTKSKIQDIDGNYLAPKTTTSSTTELTMQTKKYSWVNSESNSSWVSAEDNERSFIYNGTYNAFRNYKVSNLEDESNAYADTYTTAMPLADGYVRSGLTEGRYGTICLPCAVAAADMKGLEVFSVVGKRVDTDGNPVSLVIAEETEMEAGVPYILKATDAEIVVAYTGATVDKPGSAGGLVGVFADTRPLPEGDNYVLSANVVKKAGANAGVRANYAYINMDAVEVYQDGSSAKRIFEIGSGSAPSAISSVTSTRVVDVYSITGVCLRSEVPADEATAGLGKGVYIVGGRKVVVR